MWESFIEILTKTPWYELLLIFSMKIIEVTMGTLRMILINKGYRKFGVVLALIEIFLWVFIASAVITGLSKSPMKGISYGLGFVVGVYLGSLVEEKLAFGKVLIQAIVPKDKGIVISDTLREAGFGVTVVDARGMDMERKVLMVFANRRDSLIVVNTIKEYDNSAMIISSDTANLSGGYTKQIKQLFK